MTDSGFLEENGNAVIICPDITNERIGQSIKEFVSGVNPLTEKNYEDIYSMDLNYALTPEQYGLAFSQIGGLMERIANFGSFTVNQQLDWLESQLKKRDILLFQYYAQTDGAVQSQECLDEYFGNYCDDVIYYYNPHLQTEIYDNIIYELAKEAGDLGEMRAKRQYAQIKTGDAANISEKTIENIKRLVFNKLINHNRDSDQYEYVIKRMYGKSQWIVDERGKVSGTGGAIWYKPVNRDVYCDALKSFPLFSCIILQNGEKVDHFWVAYTVQETADTYDLLMFENDSYHTGLSICKAGKWEAAWSK